MVNIWKSTATQRLRMTYILTEKGYPVAKPRLAHDSEISLDGKFPQAAALCLGDDSKRMQTYGSTSLFVAERRIPASLGVAPVLGVCHIFVGHDGAVSHGGDEMHEQDEITGSIPGGQGPNAFSADLRGY